MISIYYSKEGSSFWEEIEILSFWEGKMSTTGESEAVSSTRVLAWAHSTVHQGKKYGLLEVPFVGIHLRENIALLLLSTISFPAK